MLDKWPQNEIFHKSETFQSYTAHIFYCLFLDLDSFRTSLDSGHLYPQLVSHLQVHCIWKLFSREHNIKIRQGPFTHTRTHAHAHRVKRKTRNILDCDQSNYSSLIIFSYIPPNCSVIHESGSDNPFQRYGRSKFSKIRASEVGRSLVVGRSSVLNICIVLIYSSERSARGVKCKHALQVIYSKLYSNKTT